MEKLRFGILGCGTIGDVHARAISELDIAELVAFCDPNEQRADEYTKRHSAKRYYLNYGEMLSAEDIDAVAICTPSGMHAEQAITALNAGKHVLLEKPMALNEKDAKAILDAAERSGKTLSVIFQARYADDIIRLKRHIENGDLGNIVFCDIYMKFWRDDAYFKASPWRGTFAMDGGGALMNQGIHGIDIMHYMLGQPKLLSANVKTMVHNIEVEDTAIAMVEYPCGSLGVIEAATSTPPGFGRRIEINGTNGYAVISDVTLEKLFISGESIIDRPPETMMGLASDPSKMGHDMHLLQIRNFVRSIRGEEKLLSTALDGYNAVSFIEKIYNESKNGGF